MADAFAPQLNSEVRFNQPVERPSMLGAVAELGGNFISAFGKSRQGQEGAAATKTDPNIKLFQMGLERVEAIRESSNGGEVAAQIAERQLAKNFAVAGINLGTEYKEVYETTTGRTWAGYGMDVEDQARQAMLKDPKFQAAYIGSIAVNKEMTDEQRLEYSVGQVAQMTAMENEITRAKTEAGYKWTTQSESAYGGAVDNFTNTIFGGMANAVSQGGRVGPQDIANVQAQWAQLKMNLTRPTGVSDDQWKAIQSKIDSVDNTLTAFEKAGSNEVLLNEITSAFANSMLRDGDGSPESVLAAMTAIKDPATLTNLMGGNVEKFIMGAGGSLKLNVATPDLFGHIVSDQEGVGPNPDPNSFLKTLPAEVKTNIEGKTPEQIYSGLEASGLLTSVVKPNDLNRPEAREQFTENAATIGAVMQATGSDTFLSNDFLKKLVANPGFIRNINALDAVDPEAATVARTYVRSGLNVEMGKQVQNLGAIDANLESKGIVWNGSDYVTTPEAAASRNAPFLGRGRMFVDPLVSGAEAIKQAKDRRSAINTINLTMKELAIAVEGQEGTTAIEGSTSAALLDRFEGGGDYNALFGFANREGGPFAGVKVSEKTIGELKSFADGEYADYSRNQLGYKATPMGRYQFVGTTLASVAQRMGLSDDTVFTPEVQDQMFVFHAKEVMDGKSPVGKRAALRGTWEGLQNASDAELDQMISEIEGGTASFGSTGVSGGTFRGSRPTDANAVASAAPAAAQRAVQNTPATLPTPTPTAAPVASPEAATAALPEQITAGQSGDAASQATQQAQIDPKVASLIQNLSEEDVNQLSENGVAPESLKFFETKEDADAALKRGDLKRGDSYILPDGSVIMVSTDRDGELLLLAGAAAGTLLSSFSSLKSMVDLRRFDRRTGGGRAVGLNPAGDIGGGIGEPEMPDILDLKNM